MKKIKVLNHSINVRELSLDKWDVPALGQMQTTKSEMLVNKDMSSDLKETTVLHESLHFANDLLAIGLDEKQVTQIGLFLRTFIVENKQFIKEMVK